MPTNDLLQKIGETLGSTASVKSVFGEPIHAEGKTVVPVARVAYGFGGGFGTGQGKGAHSAEGPANADGSRHAQGEGGGGGGGVRALPAGALEITATGTRFIPFTDMKLLTGAFVFGAALGGLFLSRRKK